MRELFLQWDLGNTSSVLFSLEYKNRPVVRILHSATKYAGSLELRTTTQVGSSVCWETHRKEGADNGTNTDSKHDSGVERYDGIKG